MEAFLGEFLGTALLVLLGDGVVANVLLKRSKGQNSGWIVITFGWAMAVAMAVYAVGPMSGAHLNPAVSIALACIGSFDWSAVPIYVCAQVLGAIFGAVLVFLTYKPHWELTEDPTAKLAVFCTAPAVRAPVWDLLTEVVGTAVLLFGVLIIANVPVDTGTSTVLFANAYLSTLAPLLVGFLVLAIGLSLGGPTGYAINPARDLGPRIAHALLPIPGKMSNDWSYSWIPVVAPLIGGILGAFLFALIRGA